jgi:argininosuccinate lyase
MFSPVYVSRVLEPCYNNWKKYLIGASYRIHRAHLVMLKNKNIIDAGTAAAIKKGIDGIEKDFTFPGAIPENTEDLYFVFEKELGRRIGEDKAGFLHTARSRNDMDAAAFRLYVRTRLIEILEGIRALFKTMSERINGKDGEEPFILYTHGQPANVSTLGHYQSSMLLDAADCVGQIRAALETVNCSPMGACAITTTGFPIDRELVSRLLGFSKPALNSYGAISVSHWLTFPAGAIRLLLTNIGRYIADIHHKASCEVGIAGFPDSLVQISSIMPQKRNPVILEHVRIQASLSIGILNGIEDLFRNIPFQDVNETGDAALDEFSRALDMALSCISLFEETVKNITVNKERVYEISKTCGITTTELADSMVRDFKISFRAAHGITSAFVRSGYKREVLRRQFAEAGFGNLPYTDGEIDGILSPEQFIARRNVTGGPGPVGMLPVKAGIGKAVGGLENYLADIKKKLALADEELRARYNEL